jgi:hypothetical protein
MEGNYSYNTFDKQFLLVCLFVVWRYKRKYQQRPDACNCFSYFQSAFFEIKQCLLWKIEYTSHIWYVDKYSFITGSSEHGKKTCLSGEPLMMWFKEEYLSALSEGQHWTIQQNTMDVLWKDMKSFFEIQRHALPLDVYTSMETVSPHVSIILYFFAERKTCCKENALSLLSLYCICIFLQTAFCWKLRAYISSNLCVFLYFADVCEILE